MRAFLVIVSGPPASGKTTIALKLAEALKLPMFSKDSFKESLFDSMGASNREWSKKVGATAIELLYGAIETQLRVSRSLIIESNFKPEFDTTRLRSILERYGADVVQVFCSAPGEILFERFAKRAQSGARHQGHDDANNLEEFRNRLMGNEDSQLPLGGELISVDTTNPRTVDIAGITVQIQTRMRV